MHNPFLLNNLTSQGFRYILFSSPEQKKEYKESDSITGKKNMPGKGYAAPNRSAQAVKAPMTLYQTAKAPNTAGRFAPPQAAPKQSEPKNYAPKPYAQNPHSPDLSTAARQSTKQNPSPLPQQNPFPRPVLPFHAWPEEWKFIHRRCQLPAERPKLLSKQIVWTYAGLEYDLFTDKPSSKRRTLIAQIIKTLSFPKGTHIFLPYRTVNGEGTSQIAVCRAGNADYSFFWSAVDFIRPRVLIVFGGQSIEELNLPPLLPTQKHTLTPVTVYALDTIMLYAENAKENEIMMNFLKTNLKVFA